MEQRRAEAGIVRPCDRSDAEGVLAIINAAAGTYRGVIPADRWHDPYMSTSELVSEMSNGVAFSGYSVRDRVVGVMGAQARHNVDLIRHAYVRPDWQNRGVGSHLLRHLRRDTGRPVLIGTWAAAAWAIRFYERHGFALVAESDVAPLLRTYWKVPDRQVATSVVLSSPPLAGDAARQLIAAAG